MQEAEKLFNDFLKSKDLKYTPQRQTILDEAYRAKNHFTADELLDYSKKKDESISKATVYRTLSLLTEGKLLEEHDFGEGKKCFEKTLGSSHHDHLICMKCQKILEFENIEIEKLHEQEAAKQNFKIVHHTHKIFGYCADCQ